MLEYPYPSSVTCAQPGEHNCVLAQKKLRALHHLYVLECKTSVPFAYLHQWKFGILSVVQNSVYVKKKKFCFKIPIIDLNVHIICCKDIYREYN